LKIGWLREALVWAAACRASRSSPAVLSIRVRRVIMPSLVRQIPAEIKCQLRRVSAEAINVSFAGDQEIRRSRDEGALRTARPHVLPVS
jgi:hypothetical protein